MAWYRHMLAVTTYAKCEVTITAPFVQLYSKLLLMAFHYWQVIPPNRMCSRLVLFWEPPWVELHAGWTCMHTNSHFQIYPAASTEILHYTTWRTWLFIACLCRWQMIMLPILATSHIVYIPLQKVKGRMYVLNLGVKGSKVNLQGSARANSTWVTCKIVTITLRCNIPCQESM